MKASKKFCKLLITCVGGSFTPDRIRAFRLDSRFKLHITGVDANPAAGNRFLVDQFYAVPMASTDPDGFTRKIFEIAVKDKINLIIPGSDEEVICFAKARKQFSKKGIRLTVEVMETLARIGDKYKTLDAVSKLGLFVPKFFKVDTVEDLTAGLKTVTDSKKRMVIKPCCGRGSRGMFFLDESLKKIEAIQGSRNCWRGNSKNLSQYLKPFKTPYDFVATEMMTGATYDVDCVARKGIVQAMVVRERIWDNALSSVSQGCRIIRHPKIEEHARRIIKGLNLDGVFDFDYGSTRNGDPGLFEINPRMSGAVASSLASGINIPSVLLRSIYNIPVSKKKIITGYRMIPVTRMEFIKEKE